MKSLTAAAAVWMAAGAACYAMENLQVVVFDYAATPRTVLDSAAEQARRWLQTAGVETQWIVCQVSRDPNQHCALSPAASYVQVKIVPPALEARFHSQEAMGFAMKCPVTEGCDTSYVFYSRVLSLADSAARPAPLVLGYVMAHEIGHVMGMGHSPSGIMKAAADRRDIQDAAAGRVCFQGNDAKSLRAAVALWTASMRVLAAAR
jgi:hypothetical protein